MKTLKRIFLYVFTAIFFVVGLCFTGCRPDSSDEGGDSIGVLDGLPGISKYEGRLIAGDVSGLPAPEGGTVAGEGEGSGESEEPQPELPAGQITASAWNDNDHYAAYLPLFETGQTEEENGKFVPYLQDNWGFVSTRRVKITVTAAGAPVSGATVTYFDSDQTERSAVTDACGVAYLFPADESGTFTVRSGAFTEEAAFNADARDITVALEGGEEKANLIKLMFVLDVTGSMGDEMDYLKAELADVIGRIFAADENTQIDLAFLFYRDDGDEEKFVFSDFVCVNDETKLDEQLKVLKKQRASGGGDYPEAVDEALLMAAEADWGEETSTRLIFHVLDAPPHRNAENKTRYQNAVSLAAKKGIRICPVLCSGADDLTEYLTRQTALTTAGTFIFVTDDSGIGLSHHDPDLPDTVVERFNDLLVRVVLGYHTGTFAEPVPWEGPAQSQNQTQGE